MREYVARLLNTGYEVTAVPDGETALTAALESLPDLVLSDVMMPRLDRFGLLAEFRSDPKTRSVPVVLLSARAGEEAKVEGLGAGADDYLVKPFSGKESSLASGRRWRRPGCGGRRPPGPAREVAQGGGARKDAFIAMLAHELRNPLGPISNAVQVLGAARDAATADRVREMVGRQVRHLSRIVDDLLDVSRVARGKVDLRRERVDLARLAFVVAGDEAAAFDGGRGEARRSPSPTSRCGCRATGPGSPRSSPTCWPTR